MSRSNPARRQALADAMIELLAEEGARGLTFRMVDARAGVPMGTTSNYFSSRDELLEQAGRRIYERLQPDPERLRQAAQEPPSREQLVVLLQDIVDRALRHRAEHLALLELRLEATRRPALHALLHGIIREQLEQDLAFHASSGLPGDQEALVLMILAINGLILDLLTVPGASELGVEGIVPLLVARVLPRA
jgi:DNA-binding transcriptional regulator YbjK